MIEIALTYAYRADACGDRPPPWRVEAYTGADPTDAGHYALLRPSGGPRPDAGSTCRQEYRTQVDRRAAEPLCRGHLDRAAPRVRLCPVFVPAIGHAASGVQPPGPFACQDVDVPGFGPDARDGWCGHGSP